MPGSSDRHRSLEGATDASGIPSQRRAVSSRVLNRTIDVRPHKMTRQDYAANSLRSLRTRLISLLTVAMMRSCSCGGGKGMGVRRIAR